MYGGLPLFETNSPIIKYFVTKIFYLERKGLLTLTLCKDLSKGFFGMMSYTVPLASQGAFNSMLIPTYKSTKIPRAGKEDQKKRKSLSMLYTRMGWKEQTDFVSGAVICTYTLHEAPEPKMENALLMLATVSAQQQH